MRRAQDGGGGDVGVAADGDGVAADVCGGCAGRRGVFGGGGGGVRGERERAVEVAADGAVGAEDGFAAESDLLGAEDCGLARYFVAGLGLDVFLGRRFGSHWILSNAFLEPWMCSSVASGFKS